MIEIRIDRHALPINEQNIRWVNHTGETREGTYYEDDGIFLVAKSHDFDPIASVQKWEPIN